MNLVAIGKERDSKEIGSALRVRGIYPTAQRLAVANVLFSRYQHVSADQLHQMLRDAGTPVAKATVYNSLGLFVERGLVREIFIDANQTFYDTNTSHHHHYYNLDTGELTDIPESLSIDINGIQPPEGTSVEEVDIVIKIRQGTH